MWKLGPASTERSWSVCVLERGGRVDQDARGSSSSSEKNLTIPLHRWCAASHNPSPYNCIYAGRQRSHRVVDVPVGVGLGGTSLINAGLVVPPHPDDFDAWPIDAREIHNAVDAVVKTMKENDALTTSTYRDDVDSQTNKIPTTLPIHDNDNETKFWTELQSNTCCTRVPLSAGKNSNTPTTVVRKTFYQGLVQALSQQQQPNLTVLTGYPVERLLFQGDVCVGVEVLSCVTGKYECIRANRQVILCAGSIETPTLLLASGIGQPDDLPSSITPVIPNFPGAVGHGLRDHILLPRVFLHPPKWQRIQSLNGVRAISVFQQQTSINSSKHGTAVAANAQISFIDSTAYPDLVPHMMACALRFRIDPDSVPGGHWINTLLDYFFQFIRILFQILIHYTPVYWIVRYCVTTFGVFLMNAESVGKITVVVHKTEEHDDNNNNKHSATETKQDSPPLRRRQLQPVIDLNYLSHPNDMEKFENAWIASDSAYDTSSMLEFLPGKFVRSWMSDPPCLHPRRFEIFAKAMVLPYFHWMGTCAMQTRTLPNNKAKNNNEDDSYVVDANFCVRGVRNLRICDASIFPTLISAPPALTCAALGAILAEKIIQEASSKTKQVK